MEVVKLMPWRQAKSPLKIPSWSGGKMSSSYIFYNWHPPDQEGNFKGEVACLQGINLTTSNTEDDVFMDGTWLLPVQWCPWHLVNTWNTLMGIMTKAELLFVFPSGKWRKKYFRNESFTKWPIKLDMKLNPNYFCSLCVKLQLDKDPLGRKASCNFMF